MDGVLGEERLVRNTVILSNIFENSDFLLSSQLVYKEIFSGEKESLWQKERAVLSATGSEACSLSS